MSGVTGGRLARMLATLGALLAAVLFAAPAARAETVYRPAACVLRAAPEATPAMLFAGSAAFDCKTRQTSLGGGTFWVLMQGFSAAGSAADPLVLRTGSVWQESVTLHIRYADGHIAVTGTSAGTTSRQLQLGALIQYDIPPRVAPVTAIFAYVEGSANIRGILLAPEIMPKSAATARNLQLAALYAGFLGLCLALLCYNFAMWCVLRHRFQLAYCATVLAMMAYAFSSSGALAWAWPAIDNNDRLRINYATLTLAAVGALLFTRHFFEKRVLPRRVIRLAQAATGLALAASAAMAILAPWRIALLDAANSAALIALLASAVPMIAFAYVRRSRFLSLFLLAWSAPMALAIVRVMSNIGIVGQHFWIDNSTVLAMSAEALLSAIAIAYRIRLLSDERDRARADESIARLLADTDPLTGLLNRRAFLATAIGAQRWQRLMLIDIDAFKEVNDRLGHEGGDEVLCVFARTLRASAPQGALAARLGGEEFALLIPAGTAEAFSPAALLERIRAAPMPSAIAVTASIGVAEGLLETEQDWAALYRHADRALYRAKHDGRDRFCSAAELANAA